MAGARGLELRIFDVRFGTLDARFLSGAPEIAPSALACIREANTSFHIRIASTANAGAIPGE
jgi:hypothetical protein